MTVHVNLYVNNKEVFRKVLVTPGLYFIQSTSWLVEYINCKVFIMSESLHHDCLNFAF